MLVDAGAGADYSSDFPSDDAFTNGCLDGHSGASSDEYGAPDGFTRPNGHSVFYGLSDCDGYARAVSDIHGGTGEH